MEHGCLLSMHPVAGNLQKTFFPEAWCAYPRAPAFTVPLPADYWGSDKGITREQNSGF
jgi:hypothetical protein